MTTASQQPRQLNELLADEQRQHQAYASKIMHVGVLMLLGALALAVTVLR